MNRDEKDNAWLDARESRRLKAEDRLLARIERLEAKAEKLIGELCREGKRVFYVWPLGGKYREGDRHELAAFLIRNKYV